jgi:TrmH family RNA methyltransferase
MSDAIQTITSLQNPRIKQTVRLRDRRDRDEAGLFLIEGRREVARALDNGWQLHTLFFCNELFTGMAEAETLARAGAAGVEQIACSAPVFRKLAYGDRTEGLLAVAPQRHRALADLVLPEHPLLIVAEAIEKPGNLGTILRSADAAGVHAVIVCDGCTDIHNPNVVRASIGTLFSVPVVEAASTDVLAWLRAKQIAALAATPHAEREYTAVDLTRGVAIVVGQEQAGLSARWMESAELQVKIPMLGQADSLNVAAATTLLLFEAVRQRRAARVTGG